MSKYLENITEALTEVLTHAANSRDHRIVGYAANVHFWIEEIEHCVAAIDGFAKRQQAFSDAVRAAVKNIREATGYAEPWHASGPLNLYYGEWTSSVEFEENIERMSGLRAKLVEASKNLLMRLWNDRLIAPEQWFEIEDRLPFLVKHRKG